MVELVLNLLAKYPNITLLGKCISYLNSKGKITPHKSIPIGKGWSKWKGVFFGTNSDFLIPILLQPDAVDLWYLKL